MKKTILLAMAILTGSAVASADSGVVNNPDNHAFFGARVSVDASIPGDLKFGNEKMSVFNPGAGVSLGLIYQQPVVANFYVQPGVEFYYDTQKYDLGNSTLANSMMKSHSSRSFGMRVPVMLGYHFDFTPNFKLEVFTGPVLKVGFSDDYYLTTDTEIAGAEAVRFHTSGSMYKDNPFTGAGLSNAYNRVDCAWRIGIGANFCRNYYVGLSGDLGMVNQIKHSNNGAYDQKNNLFQFTLGYNF
ncbi:MAG: outer membrane beta-barrel protein [Muribaculaceae bacterium]|nr:outer membrane beta-barrel protein [Muribaculaceae bacterium]